MKNVSILFMGLISFFLLNVNVSADKYKCKYTFGDANIFGNQSSFEYEVDEEKNSIKFDSHINGNMEIGAVIDIALDNKYSSYVKVESNSYFSENDDEIKKILINQVMDGNCGRKLYICYPADNEYFSYGILFDPQYISNITDSLVVSGPKGSGLVGSYMAGKQNGQYCTFAEIDESGSTGTVVDKLVKDCDFYKNYITKDDNGNIIGGELKEIYDQCNDNSSCLSQYNEKKDILKVFCNVDLKTGTYGMDPCIEQCLNLTEDIYQIEGYSVDTGDCNFSDRVIKWIANIVKWVKYIAPILVIIFGIMDFIKAIAAQSEDEMKKAQSRFIKRLIVAALVFIVPFLIEYVLTAFKIVSDNPYCGII